MCWYGQTWARSRDAEEDRSVGRARDQNVDHGVLGRGSRFSAHIPKSVAPHQNRVSRSPE